MLGHNARRIFSIPPSVPSAIYNMRMCSQLFECEDQILYLLIKIMLGIFGYSYETALAQSLMSIRNCNFNLELLA